MANTPKLRDCILALLACLWGLLMCMAMGLSLLDGPAQGELRGYNIYSGTVLVGCLLTTLLFVAWCRSASGWLVACGLLVCSGILLLATVTYLRAAARVNLRAYFSLPLPLILWLISAFLVLLEKRDASESNMNPGYLAIEPEEE